MNDSVILNVRAIVLILLTAGAMALPVDASETYADDWTTPQAIVKALHEVVSADAGQTRDWDRFRALFFDGAMISMAIKSPRMPGLMAATPEELIQQTEANYGETGFHEIPLIYEIEEFGAMGLVTSSFEIRLRRDDEEPMMRGLNHFQLLHDGERWWIVSNISTVESGDWKLPAAFDPNNDKESGQ